MVALQPQVWGKGSHQQQDAVQQSLVAYTKDKSNELGHGGTACLLVRFDPVIDDCLEGRVGVADGVCGWEGHQSQ